MKRQSNNHENTKIGKHEKGPEGGQNHEWGDAATVQAAACTEHRSIRFVSEKAESMVFP
jgi:hypothetical protein